MIGRLRGAAPGLAFAALCYVPLLLTSPGQVLADTKSYLYIDPGRLLSRAWSMWDPHIGLGTVSHQVIGFLWPMGPYYWLMEGVGAPDWVAQRLWLGSIMLLAGLGVRYLLRTFGWRGPAVAAAMCAYALTPYLLTISVRISAILLPYVALPWLIALVVRAAREGGWRHPAAFALIVATAGTTNATSILLVGIGPVLWLLWALVTREAPAARLAAVTARIGVLTLATNAWWIAGLSVQASHGTRVLRYTESVEVTAAGSATQEVLRGLGYWFFYGDDALDPWVGPSRPFQVDAALVAATFAVPVLALVAGALTRWRERSFAVLLLVVGLLLAVGVYPYGDPSPFGRALRAFLHSDVGMAMRSMPRAAPLVVLSLAVLLGAGLLALDRLRRGTAGPAAAVAIALVLLSLPPLWQRTLVPENLRRPEDLPAYWVEAGRLLDRRDDGTRVLEVPGADFTSYRWGVTVDPVTPGLMDRPMVARELVPQGGAAGWNLLKALDGRYQRNVAEPSALAPIARLLRAGDILVRSDLRFEHYDTPRPRSFWQAVLDARGLGRPVVVGPVEPNEADADVPMLDELTLTTDPTLPDPPAVAILPVEDSVPIVSTKTTAGPVVVAGDGDGVVDLAAAGLLTGDELVLYSAAMTDAELAAALADAAVLVVTDTNRRRAERWGTIRFTDGYTEPSGLDALRTDRSDARLPVFPDADDDARTVAVHAGGISANATSYGGRNEYLPEHRPANAVDGDPATAWRASRDDPVVGERLVLTTDEPVAADRLTFLAPPPPINRWVTRVRLRFDGGAPLVVDLDETSRSAPGQVVDIGSRTFRTLDVEVVADSAGPQGRYGGLSSTGFAEITIGDGALRLDELVRPPVDLLARAGTAARDHPLAIILTRLRSAPTDVERLDEEPALARRIDVHGPRQLSLAGAVRLSARATDEALAELIGDAAGPRASASSRLPDLRFRAAAALDGDRGTAWVTAFGEQAGQWLEVRSPEPVTLDHLDLEVVADEQHSLPTRLGLIVDGQRVATLDVPPVARAADPGATSALHLPLRQPVTGTTVRVVIDAVEPRTTPDWSTRALRTLPVGLAELDLGVRAGAPVGDLSTGCRSDLLTLDGRPVPVEVTGPVEAALAGGPLDLQTCDGAPLGFGAGAHDLRATAGTASGLDIDRLVLSGTPRGAATTQASQSGTGGTLRARRARSTQVEVLRHSEDEVTARVSGARPGEELWLILGQSLSPGWSAVVDGEDLRTSQLVDGFANGWRLRPAAATFDVTFRFEPQRRVTVALWLSLASALVCLALLLRRPAGARIPVTPGTGPLVTAGAGRGPATSTRTAIGLGLGAAAAGTLAAGPVVGALLGAFGVAVALGPSTGSTAFVAPLAMAASAGYVVITVVRHRPLPGLEWTSELARAHPVAWFAVLALAVDVVVSAIRNRRR